MIRIVLVFLYSMWQRILRCHISNGCHSGLHAGRCCYGERDVMDSRVEDLRWELRLSLVLYCQV